MKTNKLVSVVIPSYNHEKYIEQAIESVFQQSYRPIQLIVVDDCSKDRSPEIIASLKERYRKIDPDFKFVFVRKAQNSDAPTTINFGLSKATGEFVTILNSDDYYSPDRIKTLVEVANAKSKDLLFTDVEIVDEKGVKLPGQHPRVHWLHEAHSFRHELPSVGYAILRRPHVVTSGNLFFRQSLLKKLKGFRHYRWLHDCDFALRATRYTEPFFVSKKLLSYRIHGSNTISEMENNAKEIDRLGNARSDNEIRRIIEDFYEESMMTSTAGKAERNPLAPLPDFWPGYFLHFFRNEKTWYSGQPYFTEISFCNRSLLESHKSAIAFFKKAEMSKNDIVTSLRVFPEITYLHEENFPIKIQKNYPALKLSGKTTLKSKELGYIGTLVSITGKFKKQAPALQDSYVAIFRGRRLAGVARAISEKKGKFTYLGFIPEPIHDDENRKIKLLLIEPNRHLDYTLCVPKTAKRGKKRTWNYKQRVHFGNIDHLDANGSMITIAGWSAHERQLPISLKAYFNGQPVPALPSLYYRPDLLGIVEHQNKASISGFRFWLDLGYLRVFSQRKGVLEIRSEFEKASGPLARFTVQRMNNGHLVTMQESAPSKRKPQKRKQKS